MDRLHSFVRDEIAPSYWANAIQSFLSVGAFNFRLTQLNATTIRVPAGANDQAACIGIRGLWRFNEANADRAHPGGGAGTYDIYVTASAQNIVATPVANTDNTVYSFALAIVASGATPPIVAGTVDVYRKIGTLQWSGTAITQLDATVNMPNDAMPVDGPPAQGTRRTLGTGPLQAVAGNDARIPLLPVRVAVLSNVNIASPGATLDGVAMSGTPRVLLAGQTAPAQNGIYVWNGAAVPMTRAPDLDAAAEFVVGATVAVIAGSSIGQDFILTVAPTTLGTDPVAWSATVLVGDVTGSVGATVLANGAVTANKLATALADRLGVTQTTPATIRSGKSIVPATETIPTSAAYAVAPTPDRVSSVVLPTDAVLLILFRGWASNVTANQLQAAIFLNGNALRSSEATLVGTQTNIGLNTAGQWQEMQSRPPINSEESAIVAAGSSFVAFPAAVTTGVAFVRSDVAVGTGSGGWVAVYADPGTYTVEVRYKCPTNTAQIARRKLLVKSEAYA